MAQRETPSAEERTRTVCLLILAAIAAGMALLFLRQVLVPFVLALFLTMAVTPVMDLLQRLLRLPRWLAIATTMGIATLVLLAMGVLVSAALTEVLAKKETYIQQVDELIATGGAHARSLMAGVDSLFGESRTDALAVPDEAGTAPAADAIASELGDVRTKFMTAAAGAIGWALNATVTLMSQGLLVMIFMMFLIAGYRTPDQRDASTLNYQLRARVKEYLRIKIAVSAITGCATFIILHLLGIDLALVFGLMAFFLNFIPNIGSAIAILLPLPVILLASPEDVSTPAKILAVLLPMLVQFLMGNILEPRWMGKSLDLNPIAILLSLIFWGVLWGPVGMLLSVPITAVIKMLLERSELTQPLAVLLSDADGIEGDLA